MLNCCITQKRKWDTHEDADDEFHDAVEELSTGAKSTLKL